MRDMSHNKVTRIRNTHCAYCGVNLDGIEKDKEHVIGRRFVPVGTLDRQWNLHVNSCRSCNQRKADLENDISAITLAINVCENGAADRRIEADLSRRKRAISRRTGKSVLASAESVKIEFPFQAGRMTLDIVGPPQIDDHRVFELARFQLQGFFHFLTFQADTSRGWWWTESYVPILSSPVSDWGNPSLICFGEMTAEWEPRLICHTAHSYFSVLIKRAPNAALWSWVLEWNRSFRVIGLFGDEAPAKEFFPPAPR